MRIAVLTNSFLATESIQFLHDQHILCGIATLESNLILRKHVEHFTKQNDIPYVALRKESLEQALNEWIDACSADLVLVQTFPFKIPASSLNKVSLGFYNLHPGPLPRYRGPDPVFWQIQKGESTSGVTLHKMDEEYDTGPIILFEPVSIPSTSTYGLLNSLLAAAALSAVEKFLIILQQSGSPTELPQPPESADYQKKPVVTDLLIQWGNDTARDIQNLTRACNPNQNGSITFFRDVMTRLIEVDIVPLEFETQLAAGTVVAADNQRGLHVKCKDNQALSIHILHVEEGYYSGVRFANVFNVNIGEKFTEPSFMS